jgi:hypothetical protein
MNESLNRPILTLPSFSGLETTTVMLLHIQFSALYKAKFFQKSEHPCDCKQGVSKKKHEIITRETDEETDMLKESDPPLANLGQTITHTRFAN